MTPTASTFKQLARRVGPAVAALALFTTASFAAPGDPPAAAAQPSDASRAHSRAERRAEWIHERLERAANRLEIKASQQGAWQAFAQSVEAFGAPPAPRPGRDADATAIARYRADRAADAARKLAQVADATAKLESVLNDDQRKVFDEMAQRLSQGRRHHREGGEHHRRES